MSRRRHRQSPTQLALALVAGAFFVVACAAPRVHSTAKGPLSDADLGQLWIDTDVAG